MTEEEYYNLKAGDWVQNKDTKFRFKLTGCLMRDWKTTVNVWISKEALIKNFDIVKNMEIKEMKIIAPEGYELDRENSTLDCIRFKKIEKPESWEEYCKMMEGRKGYRTDTFGEYKKVGRGDSTAYSTFNTKEEAKAFCALGKLIQLRDAWIGDWKPKYGEMQYIIETSMNRIDTSAECYNSRCYSSNYILSFPTEEMRNRFFKTFKNLLEDAKMFL